MSGVAVIDPCRSAAREVEGDEMTDDRKPMPMPLATRWMDEDADRDHRRENPPEETR